MKNSLIIVAVLLMIWAVFNYATNTSQFIFDDPIRIYFHWQVLMIISCALVAIWGVMRKKTVN